MAGEVLLSTREWHRCSGLCGLRSLPPWGTMGSSRTVFPVKVYGEKESKEELQKLGQEKPQRLANSVSSFPDPSTQAQ